MVKVHRREFISTYDMMLFLTSEINISILGER